ncbi:MAG: hypothetical protein K8R86_02860 [Bacteroidales bacterium]|nr:hypothetical protein [Bacteroidales bacterium]
MDEKKKMQANNIYLILDALFIADLSTATEWSPVSDNQFHHIEQNQ